MGEVTRLIERARGVSREAFDRVFERLHFGGMEGAEINEAPNLSERTVACDRDKARQPLAHALCD